MCVFVWMCELHMPYTHMYICIHFAVYRPASTICFSISIFPIVLKLLHLPLSVCACVCVYVSVCVFLLGHVLRLLPRHWGFMNRLQGRTGRQAAAACVRCLIDHSSLNWKWNKTSKYRVPFSTCFLCRTQTTHTYTVIHTWTHNSQNADERRRDRSTVRQTEGTTGNKADRRRAHRRGQGVDWDRDDSSASPCVCVCLCWTMLPPVSQTQPEYLSHSIHTYIHAYASVHVSVCVQIRSTDSIKVGNVGQSQSTQEITDLDF